MNYYIIRSTADAFTLLLQFLWYKPARALEPAEIGTSFSSKTLSTRFTSSDLQPTMNTNKNEIDVVVANERISNQIQITAKAFLIVTQIPQICSESFLKGL